MYLVLSVVFLSAISLQAVANNLDLHEGSYPKSSRSSQRRAEAIISGNPLTQEKSNNTVLIPLTISLNASPSTNLTILKSPRAEAPLLPSTSAPHRFLKSFDSIMHRVICGKPDITISSQCDKRKPYDPSAWRRYCYPIRSLPPGVPYHVQYGACAETEICMDATARQEKRHYALCVDLGDSVRVGREQEARGGAGGENGNGGGGRDGELKREVVEETIHSTVEVGLGKDFGFKVLLMEDDGTTPVFAENLDVKALVREDTQQTSLTQKPRALSERCDDCAEIGLPIIPADAAILSAKVSLREDLKNVRMYVVSVEL